MQQPKQKETGRSLQTNGASEFLSNNPIIWQALCTTSTSNSWSFLSAVVTKVNQKLARNSFQSQRSSSSSSSSSSSVKVTSENLVQLLNTVGHEILKMHGIWHHSFGSKYQPILCINPAYGRARLSQAKEILAAKNNEAISSSTTSSVSPHSAELLEAMINLQMTCTCRSGGKSEEGAAEEKIKMYYSSHDYNAGRHEETSSRHHASCAAWTPPSTGHLHSWRRGYDVK